MNIAGRNGLWLPLAGLLILAACEREPVLEGLREDIRAPLTAEGEPSPRAVPANQTRAISLPPQVNHSEWTHRNGSAQHRITHPALGPNLTPLWTAGIGAGEGRRVRITADPVVAGGRIFTLDARAGVAATAANGAALWSRDLAPASDRGEDASGGGLAYGGGTLFVTTGFGALVALDPATGAEIWRQGFDAPVTGTPTVEGGTVYVVARDGTAWAVNAANGRVIWQLSATPSLAGMVGSAGPALTGRLAILPFGSGELLGVAKGTGRQVWGGTVLGDRPGRAYAAITDITGDPVVQDNVIYVGNQSGRVEAREADSGATVWVAREGAYSPVWPVGDAVFLVSDAGELVRLDAATGLRVWGVPLPYFESARPRRLKDVYGNYGPVLAGGRLIVASGDGVIRSFDPASGALVASVALPGGAASNPVVVGGVLYVVSANGQLHAFR